MRISSELGVAHHEVEGLARLATPHHGLEAPHPVLAEGENHGAAYVLPWANGMLWVCFAAGENIVKAFIYLYRVFSSGTFFFLLRSFFSFRRIRKKNVLSTHPATFQLSHFSGTSCHALWTHSRRGVQITFLPCEIHASESQFCSCFF